MGSIQPCALQVHQHHYQEAQTTTTVANEGPAGLVGNQQAETADTLPSSVASNNETRPVNVAVYYLIKFAGVAWPWAPGFGAGAGG